jgi:hypothetical protein
MANSLRFPPPPRHTAEDDFLDVLGPAWSAMTPEQRRLYGGPITLAREEAAEAAGEITEDSVRDLLRVAVHFPRTVRSDGIARAAQKWCETDGAVALAARLDSPAAREVQRAPLVPRPVREQPIPPRARALRLA